LRSITVRLPRGCWRGAVFLAGALARDGRRADFAAVLAFCALVALPAPLVLALLRFAATRVFRVPPALAAFRVRATAAVFFRAALFLAVFRARDFVRADPLFLVAAALRLAIALVLSATG
jgi:hypothetical protein